MIKRLVLFFSLLPLASTWAVGAKSGLGAAYYIQVCLSLLIVLGFIYFASKLFAMKFNRPKTQAMKVIDYLQLEPQVSLYKIKVDNDEYVICVGNKNISTLQKTGPSFQHTDFNDSVSFAQVLDSEKEKTV